MFWQTPLPSCRSHELNLNETEMINGGSVASVLVHIAGTVAAGAVGFVAGPVAAAVVGIGFVGINEIVDRVTD